MIQAKKSLGQNFLKSEQILDKIVGTANLKVGDVILEVGPGKGSLTEKLLATATKIKIMAVEKDHRLIEFLQEKFKKEIQNKKLELIYGDILKIASPRLARLGRENYKIIANIPYYITGQFLRKFLSADFPPTTMVIMLQKEVAERITTTGKESILSLSVKAYGHPKYITTVDAKNFSPQPKVDSAILLIENISKDFFKNLDEQRFFKTIKQGFSSKRKMLVNNLSFIPKKELEQIFKNLKIPLKIRAEDLSLADWQTLYFELKKYPR